MSKPDLIITWPNHVEYPLFREFIRDTRDRYDGVIIVFINHGEPADYREFVCEAMKNLQCTFVDSPKATADKDWRNVAVNAALNFSGADWVWFMEQDFLVTSEHFWIELDLMLDSRDVIGVKEGDRLHPCCLLVKRDMLEKTSRNFGIVSDKTDHFGVVQKELEALGAKIGVINSSTYHHMAGLSHNYYLASKMLEVTYRPDEFKRYLQGCLALTAVPLDPRFIAIAKALLQN